MSNDLTSEFPIQKTVEAKLQTEVTTEAKKNLIEAIRPIMSNALGQVLGVAILGLIGWLASQGIRVEIQKNTEAVQESNALKQLELEAWGIRRVKQTD